MMKEAHGYREAVEAAQFLARRWSRRPRVGIVLGSGLGQVVSRIREAKEIPYKSIPHFPRLTVKGHAGRLHLGFWGQVPVAILEGRVHLYEGYAPAEVAFPTRVMALAGVECMVLTCAAGGIAPRAVPGSFMIFSDHLNLLGSSPLAGPREERWGERFVDLTEAYDPRLRRYARQAAAALRLKCFEGIYAAVPGPHYETPAEIQALKRLGASAVGMSVVPEVLAARQLGARVLAIAVIANRAAGLSGRPLSHAEVLDAGKRTAHNLARLLNELLPKLEPKGREITNGAGPPLKASRRWWK
jgi:purine-nucleoside phosphorylase